MSRAARLGALAGLGVLIAGLVLAQLAPTGEAGRRAAGPSPDDAGPAGLLGVTLFYEASGHQVERVSTPPSEGDLSDAETTLLVDPGTLTAADGEALGDLASRGGRVILAGDPGTEALRRILGGAAELSGAGPARSAPLAPTPETGGIASVESGSGPAISTPGPALPVLGGDGRVAMAVSNVGEGIVVVLGDASPLLNEHLASADNARLALNLAGAPGRGVQLVEAVRTPPGSGLAALPSEWGWAFGGLFLAAIALAAARSRRLGPPELESRPLSPPRRQYVDALAATLARTRDPAAAAEPLRAAARERLARRAGLGRDFGADELRRAAEAAGLAPDEVRALGGTGGGEDEMLAVGAALARLGRGTLTEV